MAPICPLCESGSLRSALVDELINYGGAKLLVQGVEISRCEKCDEELVLPGQARANERRFADVKRRHEQLLTSDEIVAWRGAMCLTQAQAAKLLGGGINAFSKYERGEVIQARSMDLLMRVVLESAEARSVLFERAGLPSPLQAKATPWSLVKADAQAMFGNVMSAAVKGIAANEELSPWHEVKREPYAIPC